MIQRSWYIVGGVWHSKPLTRSQASRPSRNTFVYCTFFLLLAVASAAGAGADVTLDDTMRASAAANAACAVPAEPGISAYLECIKRTYELGQVQEAYALQKQHAREQSGGVEPSRQRKEEVRVMQDYMRAKGGRE